LGSWATINFSNNILHHGVSKYETLGYTLLYRDLDRVENPRRTVEEIDGRIPSGIGAWWTSVAEYNKWQEFEELRVWRRIDRCCSKTLTKTNSLPSWLIYVLRDFIHTFFLSK
jgi:hypothetical protein